MFLEKNTENRGKKGASAMHRMCAAISEQPKRFRIPSEVFGVCKLFQLFRSVSERNIDLHS